MFKSGIAGKALFFILALFLVSFSGCGSGGASAVSSIFSPTTYSISGTITFNGGGLSGATVTLTGASNATATTNASGAYTITGLSNGSYTVTPTLAGYTFSPTSNAVNVNSSNVTAVNFTASATYSISGTITLNGAAQSGVTVSLTGNTISTATTNASGAYTFSGLSNGTYTVTPQLAGYTYTPASRTITINNANSTAQDFTATAAPGTYSITGTITLNGSAQAGVSVALTGAATSTVATNASGVYTFTSLANGNYTVTPSLAGYTYTPASLAVTVSNANSTANNFAATALTYSITGTITLSGAPQAGVTVALSGASTGTTTTNASGVYIFTGRANGAYAITPSLAGYTYTPTSLSVTINNANLTAQDFSATAVTYSITGTITLNGAAQQGVTVALTGASTGTTTTNASGVYTFTGLANGAYTVTPTLAGFTYTPANRAVTINNANSTGQNFAATAVTYSISGTITLNGAAQQGVSVALTGASTGTTTTNASGVYTFTGLANGAYTVTPTLAGFTYSPVNRAVTINNANSTGQNFAATAVTYSITGTITLGANPQSGVTVALTGASTGTTTTNASGVYTFTGLANGAYTVTPTLAGFTYTPVNRAITINNANSTGQNFSATAVVTTYNITGTITLSGSPQSGVTVALTGASTGTATTNASGVYTFTGLANGAYTVTPSLAGFTYTPANRAVTINNANSTAQDFAANPVLYSISGTITSGGPGLAGVTVNLTGAATASTVTDASGNYSFPNRTNGAYTVTPVYAGYTMSPTFTNVTINNANVSGVNFTAAIITYTLSGTITDGVNPLAGVTVTLSGASSGTTTTNASGNYTLTGLPHGGSFAVTPTLAGYIFSPLSASVTNVTNNPVGVNFTGTVNANPTYSISGTITFNGTGLPGVSVNITGAANASVVTAAGGTYTVAGLPAGAYTVTPQLSGFNFNPGSTNTTIVAANITAIDFTASGIYTISGNINTFNGGPVTGATITLTGAFGATTTSNNGSFSFNNLPPGTYTVTPTYPGVKAMFYPAAQTFVLNLNANVQFGANVFYDVSGAITYGGIKTGPVYVTVDWFCGGGGNCGGSGVAGTSIAAPGAYTIRGVQSGTYQVCAWMDDRGTGIRNASNPMGCVNNAGAGFNVNNANLTGINVVIADPTLPATQQAAPLNVAAFPSSGMALVFWDTVYDANGNELPQAYNVYWHTASNVGPANYTGRILNRPALNDSHAFVGGLTNGVQYYFAVTAVINGIESLTSLSFGPVTIGIPVGGNTVSGTATFTGITPTGPLVVGAYTQGGGGGGPSAIYYTVVPTPVSPQAYTIPGVPTGQVGRFAFIDMNNNGIIDAGDVTYGMGNTQIILNVTGNMTGVDFAFSLQNSLASVGTEHSMNNGGGGDNYGINLSVVNNAKIIRSAALTAAANLPVPLDFPKTPWQDLSRWFQFGAVRPNIGDQYTIHVVYTDGTQEDKIITVQTVLDLNSCGVPVSPAGSVPGQTTPTFTWTAPPNPPASYQYSVNVWQQNNGSNAWNMNNSLPSTQLSALYNFDGNASQATLTPGVGYTWQLSTRDSFNNSCGVNTQFTP